MEEWKVFPHGSLDELSSDLWWVQGSMPRMTLPRACTVVREEGQLLIHSPICLEEDGMQELEALGELRWLIVPNGLHRFDAPRYKARYPQLETRCPPGARERVAKAVPVDGSTEDFAIGRTRFVAIQGVAEREAVMRVQRPEGVTLVFTDLLFNVAHHGGLGGLILRLMGSSGGPRTTPLAKLTLVKDKRELRRSFEALADDDVVRLVPGHGQVIETDATGTLQRVAAAL